MKEMSLKRKGIRSLLGAVLGLMMCLVVMPTLTVYAAGTSESEPQSVTSYATLKAALEDSNITYIRLLYSINETDLASPMINIKGTKVLDLRNNTVTCAVPEEDTFNKSVPLFNVGKDASLQITGNGDATIEYYNKACHERYGCATVLVNGGNLNVTGVTISNRRTGSCIEIGSDATVNLGSDTTINASNGFAIKASTSVKSNSTLSINGATIQIEDKHGAFHEGGNDGYGAMFLSSPNITLDVTAGTFEGAVAVTNESQTKALSTSKQDISVNGADQMNDEFWYYNDYSSQYQIAYLDVNRVRVLTPVVVKKKIETITDIDVEVTAPVAGKMPQTDIPEAKTGYSFSWMRWLVGDTPNEVSGAFEEGVQYRVMFYARPTDGYKFADASKMNVTVNGQKVSASVNSYGAVSFSYYFPVTEAAPVDDTVKTGKCGSYATWTYVAKDKTLTISGNGALYNPVYGMEAFCDLDWDTCTIEEGITMISDYFFSVPSASPVKAIYIADSVETIGKASFAGTKIEKIYFGENSSLKEIKDAAFDSCEGLVEVSLPSGLQTIGAQAFLDCYRLETIHIPLSVTNIDNTAFYGTELVEVYYEGTQKQWDALMSTRNDDDPLKNAILISEHVHKGGAATCTKKAICEICGEEYGEVNSGNHDFSKCVSNGDGTHKVMCKDCDTVQEGHDKDACSGGKATCTKKAKCTKCGKEYGKLAEHTLKTTTTKATLTADGKKETKCTVCGKVTKTTKIYAAKTIKLSKTTYTYDGKAKKPTVTVKDSKGKAIATSNYSLKYDDGRKNVGKYDVKITFKGDYKGSKTLTFTINPKATTLKSVTPASKAFTATWSKQTTQVDGYEVEYALDKNFTSSAKKVAVTKNTTTSKKISSLKSKKTYYVRVRTYKKVGTEKYYSDWSKVLNVKTK